MRVSTGLLVACQTLPISWRLSIGVTGRRCSLGSAHEHTSISSGLWPPRLREGEMELLEHFHLGQLPEDHTSFSVSHRLLRFSISWRPTCQDRRTMRTYDVRGCLGTLVSECLARTKLGLGCGKTTIHGSSRLDGCSLAPHFLKLVDDIKAAYSASSLALGTDRSVRFLRSVA